MGSTATSDGDRRLIGLQRTMGAASACTDAIRRRRRSPHCEMSRWRLLCLASSNSAPPQPRRYVFELSKGLRIERHTGTYPTGCSRLCVALVRHARQKYMFDTVGTMVSLPHAPHSDSRSHTMRRTITSYTTTPRRNCHGVCPWPAHRGHTHRILSTCRADAAG